MVNPVFDYEWRRIGWPRTPKQLRFFKFLVTCGIVGLFAAWYVLGWLDRANGSLRASVYWLDVLLLTSIIGLAFVTDVYALMATVVSINRRMVNGQWDTLRLTPLSENLILKSIYHVAQIRATRAVVLERSVRLAFLVFITLAVHLRLTDSYWQCPYAVLCSDFGFIFVIWPALLFNTEAILLTPVALGVYIAYLLEPRWRMRAVLALGLMLSAQIRSTTFAVLAAFGVVLLSRITQIILLVVAMMMTYWLSTLLLDWGISNTSLGFFILSAPIALTIVAFYALYDGLWRWALGRAKRIAFRSE